MKYGKYIKAELLVLIPVLYLIGTGLKKSRIPDKYIPGILGVLSVLLSGLWVFAEEPVTGPREAALACFTAVTQGILLAGASVYINQLYIQARKK